MKFYVGKMIILKVSPSKDIFLFGKRGKLGRRYTRYFKVFEKIGTTAYILSLPPQLGNLYDMFHISLVRNYLPNSQHQINYNQL